MFKKKSGKKVTGEKIKEIIETEKHIYIKCFLRVLQCRKDLTTSIYQGQYIYIYF